MKNYIAYCSNGRSFGFCSNYRANSKKNKEDASKQFVFIYRHHPPHIERTELSREDDSTFLATHRY